MKKKKVPPLPRYTSAVLEKYFKNKYPVYSDIVESFEKGLPQLKATIETHREVLTEVKRKEKKIPKWSLFNLL